MNKGKPAYLAISIITRDGKYYCEVGTAEDRKDIFCRGEYPVFVGEYPLSFSKNEAIEGIKYFSRKYEAEMYAREQNEEAKRKGYYKYA